MRRLTCLLMLLALALAGCRHTAKDRSPPGPTAATASWPAER